MPCCQPTPDAHGRSPLSAAILWLLLFDRNNDLAPNKSCRQLWRDGGLHSDEVRMHCSRQRDHLSAHVE